MVSVRDQSAIYTRQNSVNFDKEYGHQLVMPQSTRPMLERQASRTSTVYRKSRCLFRQISKDTSTLIKCVVIVSLILNVLAIPAIGVLTTLYFQKTCSHPPQSLGAPDLVCYPCDNGLPGVPGVQKTSNGFCCASKRNSQVQHLVKNDILPSTSALIQQRRCDQAVKAGLGGKERHAKKRTILTVAHLLVKVRKTKEARIIQWASQAPEGGAFIQGGLEIEDDMILIKRRGTYRIRSHFSLDSISNIGLVGVTILDHKIIRQRNGTVLDITSIKTMLNNTRYESSVAEGIFNFREGDKIIVRMNTYKYVYDLDIANTMDIVKLD